MLTIVTTKQKGRMAQMTQW